MRLPWLTRAGNTRLLSEPHRAFIRGLNVEPFILDNFAIIHVMMGKRY